MNETAKPILTTEDLNRAIREEITRILTEQRQEIIKRAHARLRAERSEMKAKSDESAS